MQTCPPLGDYLGRAFVFSPDGLLELANYVRCAPLRVSQRNPTCTTRLSATHSTCHRLAPCGTRLTRGKPSLRVLVSQSSTSELGTKDLASRLVSALMSTFGLDECQKRSALVSCCPRLCPLMCASNSHSQSISCAGRNARRPMTERAPCVSSCAQRPGGRRRYAQALHARHQQAGQAAGAACHCSPRLAIDT